MKITREHVLESIAQEEYSEVGAKQSIICVLTLKNGHKVIGEAHTLSPDDFAAEKGAIAARLDAERQVYPLLSFLAREADYQRRLRELNPANDAPRIILPH